jgi:predicted nucleic acid-binding protein
MTSYPPRESAKTDYAIPKPTRLNLLVPPAPPPPHLSTSSIPPPTSTPDHNSSGVLDTYISQARILAEANPISRETQSERIKRVRKLAEDKFKLDQDRIKRANRDRNDLGYKGDISDDPIIIEDMDRPNGVGAGHRLPTDVEANLARPHTSSGGDVRIPSRYQTTTSTYTSTTTAHTSTSTYTYSTDSRGTASVHVSNISDSELHRKITKKMAEKAERQRQRDLQKERQRKRDIEEAKYKAARLAQEAWEKEIEAANKERKRRERERERQNGRGYEEAEEAFKRSRRGSTPLFNRTYGSGPGTDEDHGGIPRSEERGSDGWGEGDGKRGEGSGYGRVHNSTSTRSNSREREKKERERYISRWNKLLSNSKNSDSDSDMIIETELSYSDIPWPIYAKSNLDKKSISLFLSNVALLPLQGGIISGKEGKEAERKVLREAIRNFHPDRFLSKVLPKVREGEREKVKESMEVCSRVLTDLIMENSKSR